MKLLYSNAFRSEMIGYADLYYSSDLHKVLSQTGLTIYLDTVVQLYHVLDKTNNSCHFFK